MTTLWADGFDSNSTTDLAYDYTGSPTSLAFVSGRRSGGYAVRFQSYAYNLKRTLPSASGTIFMSMALNLSSLSSGGDFFEFREGTVIHDTLTMTSLGAICVNRSTGTLLGSTANGVLSVGNWVWFQIKLVIHASAGSVEIRDASGNVLLSLSGLNTRNGGTSGVCDNILVGPDNTISYSAYCDDLHVWDSTGAICNTFTTETRIDVLFPSAAGDVTQFTPSTPPNWECVNENPASTVDYVSNATAGNQDLYQFTDLPHTPVNIYSVQRSALASKDDAGARSLKLLAKSGSAVNTGSAVALNFGSWARQYDVLEADPNTSVAWTPAGVNAAQFGLQTL